MACAELSLVGRHNVANVLTVLALLDSAGVNFRLALDALKSYTGLTHRCQVVADNHGINLVNDSKATNVASTLAALSGLKSKVSSICWLVAWVRAYYTPLAPYWRHCLCNCAALVWMAINLCHCTLRLCFMTRWRA